MQYLYEKEHRSFEDLASGRVLYNLPGATSFPCRLASEVFLRCVTRLSEKGVGGPYTLYDPCCGGGYLLTVLGLFHGPLIRRIVASDVDDTILSLAERNLSLLSASGMEQRIRQLETLYREFGKASHHDALDSARRLQGVVLERGFSIDVACFRADILNPDPGSPTIDIQTDIVITDFPYGDLTHWSEDSSTAAGRFIEGIIPTLKDCAVVAVASDKHQSVRDERLVRFGQLKVGKRQVSLLEYKKG